MKDLPMLMVSCIDLTDLKLFFHGDEEAWINDFMDCFIGGINSQYETNFVRCDMVLTKSVVTSTTGMLLVRATNFRP